ncbi:DUF3870 domain-containing protein [Gottfriedia acidiceleris]|uniref:DUF3870 domain-containing protein n=1 Tax=Bacillaceae TaxID=186817 RepID=UPI000BECF941|nr:MULTISPECIES: DUF3870 domain-containing protein [unclassified Bacillus (in: firmicutes)]PEC50076.1 hypothetical protein CON00_09510 [Bacillus sp. AFS096315]PFM79251.1 hypothetical protein COJ46_13215 [Bacillus sp. AFS077874]
MYNKDTIYIIGDAKTSSNNPIMQKYNAFFIGLVVDRTSHLIMDADCSATISLTSSFVKHLFVGQSMSDVDGVIHEINNRYFGSSQKALTVAFKNAHIKYKQIIES